MAFGFKKKSSSNMTTIKAEAIINLYGGALAKGGLTRSISFLPCSKARIKYAYYVYLEALVNEGLLTNEIAQNLINTYAMLPSFIDDNEADKVNNIMRIKKQQGLDLNKPENKHYVEALGDMIRFIPYSEYLAEIEGFIEECYKLKEIGQHD